jgi:hypothetical protein
MTQVLTSSAGILALIDETDYELKELALQRLESIVDVFWTEISESIRKMYIHCIIIIIDSFITNLVI